MTASLLIDRKGWSRPKATILSASVVFLGSILAALSLGASDSLSSFEFFEGKKGVLATLDHLAANWLLPLGGLGTTIFVGWKLGTPHILEELGIRKSTLAFKVWLWIVRIVAPIAIIYLLVNVILGKDFS